MMDTSVKPNIHFKKQLERLSEWGIFNLKGTVCFSFTPEVRNNQQTSIKRPQRPTGKAAADLEWQVPDPAKL